MIMIMMIIMTIIKSDDYDNDDNDDTHLVLVLLESGGASRRGYNSHRCRGEGGW